MGHEGVRPVQIAGWHLRPGKPRVAMVQCQPPLIDFASQEGRVRLSRDADDYIQSLYAALDLARIREVTFCVFPEYSWPATEAERLAQAVGDLLDGSLVIAPFEHLSLSEYENVLVGAGVDSGIVKDEIDDAAASIDFRDRAIVNACLVLVKVAGNVLAYPQRKLRPAQLEEEAYSGRWSFVRGRSVRVFRGEGAVAIAVLICFDFIARDPRDDFEPLRDLGAEALTYIFVPECNPRPLHTTYVESLNSLFRAVHPPHAVMFVNVAERTPLAVEDAQLGFSAVVGRIGDASFDDDGVVVIDGFVQDRKARSIGDLRNAVPSLPNPEVRTLIVRTEPSVAVVELPRIGGSSSMNVRETRSPTEVSLYRFLGDLGWQRIYRLTPFPSSPKQLGVPRGYVAQDWDLVGVDEARKELINLITRTNDLPVWVTGEGGMGKTALVADTLQELFGEYDVIWIDLGDLEYTEGALRERLLIAFGATMALEKDPVEQFDALRQMINRKPTVLVLDSYDRWRVDAFPGWIAELLTGWMPRIVITSRERPAERSGDVASRRAGDPQIGVRKLSVDEAHTLIEAVSKQAVQREDVEIVTGVTDRSALACVWFGELLRHSPAESEQLIKRLDPAKPGIQAVYDAMLHGVSTEARMLVGVVCQLPAPVAKSDLLRIIGCKSGQLNEAIRELERRSLIMEREGGWQPRHPFVKQYWRQPAGDPREIVARTAERSRILALVLRWAAKVLDKFGGELNFEGYTFLESRWANLGYLLRQLEDSESIDDQRLFLQLWDRADTFLWTKARWRERLALGRAAEKISRKLGDQRALGKALYESIAEVLWHLHGPSPQISGYLDEAAELFDKVGDLVHRARVEWYRSRLLAQRGDLDAAIRAAQSAVTIAERSGDARTIGLAHHGVGNVHRRLGQTRRALEEFEIGRQHFTKANDLEMLAVARRRLGSVRMHEGDLGQALLDLESSTDQLRSLGLPSEAAESAVLHAQVLAKLGEVRDAARERDVAALVLEPLGSSVRNDEIAEVTRLIELGR